MPVKMVGEFRHKEKKEYTMNKKNYLILPVFFIVLIWFIFPVLSFSGTVETRISSGTLQSFIENTFPGYLYYKR